MSTPTPRTDSVLEWVRPAGSDCGPPNEQYVYADFARTLERELACEREKVRVLRAALQNLCDEQNAAPLETRREQWHEAMDEACAALAATEETKP